MKKLTDLILLESVLYSTNVYPQSVFKKDGTETQRSEYGNGWNDALIDIYKRWNDLRNYFLKLSSIDKEALANLISKEDVVIKNDKIFIQLNDIFVHGPDEEELDVKDIQLLFMLFTKYNCGGTIAFVATKRNAKPFEFYDRKDYKAAIEYINNYVLGKKETT